MPFAAVESNPINQPVTAANLCTGSSRALLADVCGSETVSPQTVSRLVWAFVILGLIARSVRYLLKFPIWEDEAFLSANLIDADLSVLSKPLKYVQVAPYLYLVMQWATVRLAGFHELSLRLVAFLSGIGSLLLFPCFAGRLLKGLPYLFAVAVFAVAYPCIRYAAEAKPYGSDLFVALVLLYVALRYLQTNPGGIGLCDASAMRSTTAPRSLSQSGTGRGWLWTLMVATPLAIGISFPAAFVVGGISVTLAYAIRLQRRHEWPHWILLNVVLLASFGGFYLLSSRQQTVVHVQMLHDWWAANFPPLTDPRMCLLWLIETHTSEIVAYPLGGARGASTFTAVLIGLALTILLRKRRIGVVLLLLAPLALTLVAAALQKYPYGGSVRLHLYMAPAFCLLAGLGWARSIPIYARRVVWQHCATAAALSTLFAIGAGSILRDMAYPYKSLADEQARAFARWFWFNAELDGEVACGMSDLELPFADKLYDIPNWSAEYLCNQRIYSPRHARGGPVNWQRLSPSCPLRCVLYRTKSPQFDHEARDRWLTSMCQRYDLVGHEELPMIRMDKRGRSVIARDVLEVYRFSPKQFTQPAMARQPLRMMLSPAKPLNGDEQRSIR